MTKKTFNKNEYITPDWLFEELDEIFHFNLDAAATKGNSKCKRFYGITQINTLIQGKHAEEFEKLTGVCVEGKYATNWEITNSLEKKWDRSVWCNPPYGRTDQGYTLKN